MTEKQTINIDWEGKTMVDYNQIEITFHESNVKGEKGNE